MCDEDLFNFEQDSVYTSHPNGLCFPEEVPASHCHNLLPLDEDPTLACGGDEERSKAPPPSPSSGRRSIIGPGSVTMEQLSKKLTSLRADQEFGAPVQPPPMIVRQRAETISTTIPTFFQERAKMNAQQFLNISSLNRDDMYMCAAASSTAADDVMECEESFASGVMPSLASLA